MASIAPGQQYVSEDPICYNCGVRGHFVVACPEPTRSVPAGLEASLAQRESTRKGGPDRGQGSGKTSKGPIITRYHPPPPKGSGPIVHRYGPPPPPQYGPPAPYSPYSQPPSYGQVYASGSPLAQSPSGPYGPAIPPTPPGSAPYAYGQSPYYGPPPVPPPIEQGYFPPVPPPQHPPVGYPPPPHAGYHGSQPSYAPPYSQPFPYPPTPYGQSSPPPYPYPYASTPTWTPPPPPGQTPPAQRRPHQQRHRQRQRDSFTCRQHPQSQKTHSRNSVATSPANESNLVSPPPAESQIGFEKGTNKVVSEEDGPDAPEEGEIDEDDEFEWTLSVLFKEPTGTHPADPVAKPLPTAYTEDILLPPAYNAKCIISQYFNSDDPDRFCRPIRETEYWSKLKDDPAFVDLSSRGQEAEEVSNHLNDRPATGHLKRSWSESQMPLLISDGHSDMKQEHKRNRRDTPPRVHSVDSVGRDDGSPSTFHKASPSVLVDRSASDNNSSRDRCNASPRQDSGYYSSRTPLNQRVSRDGGEGVQAHQIYDEERSRSRSRSPTGRGGRSRSRSDDEVGETESPSSPLTALEAELLGQSYQKGKSRSKNSDRDRHHDSSPKLKRRRPKVNDAYSRRW